MKKSKAIIILVLILTAIIGMGYFALGIVTDTMDTTVSGDSIKLGLDLQGGVSIKYEAAGDTAPSS